MTLKPNSLTYNVITKKKKKNDGVVCVILTIQYVQFHKFAQLNSACKWQIIYTSDYANEMHKVRKIIKLNM